MQNLLGVILVFGRSSFLFIEKSILQSFIFEDVTKFDSLNDMNELTLIKEQKKVKCMNEVADKVIATDLSSILTQPIVSEQEGFVVSA